MTDPHAEPQPPGPPEPFIDPIPALYAACENVADGRAGEIELEWRTTVNDGAGAETERHLAIFVRRSVRPIVMPADTGPGGDPA